MPIVRVQILEDRKTEKKKKLITEVTNAVINSLEVPRESVRVIIEEFPKEHWSIGGVTVEEREAQEKI